MIQEININEIKDIYSPEGLFYLCIDELPKSFVFFDNYKACPVLTPNLTKERRIGLVSNEQFAKKYKIKIKNSTGVNFIHYLRSLNDQIYLVTDVDTGTLMSIVNSL